MHLRETLQSVDYDNIFGVGDAGMVMMQDGSCLQMACATAMPMGVHAADTILRTLDGNTPQAFDFGSLMVCISLGRRAGLVQFTHADGTPTNRILTERTGAIVKELISRYTVFALRLEKHLPGSYQYRKGRTAIASPMTTQQTKVCSL
jgi:NADH dehydrogenase FAD-containing subunit